MKWKWKSENDNMWKIISRNERKPAGEESNKYRRK